ncbi:hypothetical protein M6B38_244835 [Iris pallida]|uniref:Uncharacterized protein n=1 Tax=Iris pallida TaxID=29817 RepID=A0AAX6DI29_IRIPA|nr:hypothetical protein M6B38_244835 [Iris pallida]
MDLTHQQDGSIVSFGPILRNLCFSSTCEILICIILVFNSLFPSPVLLDSLSLPTCSSFQLLFTFAYSNSQMPLNITS